MTGKEMLMHLATVDLDKDSGFVLKSDIDQALRLPGEIIRALYKAARDCDYCKTINLAGQLIVRLEEVEKLIQDKG